MHQVTGTIDHVCSMLYLRHWSHAYVLLVQCPVSILATTITQMCNMSNCRHKGNEGHTDSWTGFGIDSCASLLMALFTDHCK